MQFTLTELLHHMGLFARVIVGVMAWALVLTYRIPEPAAHDPAEFGNTS